MNAFIHADDVAYTSAAEHGGKRCETCGQVANCPVMVLQQAHGWCELWLPNIRKSSETPFGAFLFPKER